MTETPKFKTGDRVGFVTSKGVEPVRVSRWLKSMGPRECLSGYVPVRFSSGERLMVHEASLTPL